MAAARWMAVLFTGILMAAPAGAEVRDLLGLPGPVAVDGQSYRLAWSAQPSPDYRKHEYVPVGQSVDHYDQMLLVERVAGDLKVIDAVASQMAMLEQRQGTDPLVRFEVLQKDARNEVDLDFLMSGQDAQGESVVEWNLYRYLPMTSGVLLFGISHRAYGDTAVQAFLDGLDHLRATQTGMFLRTPVPSVTGG